MPSHLRGRLGKRSDLDNEFFHSAGEANAARVLKRACAESSERIWKSGTRLTRNGEVQRWLCRDFGFRFSGVKQRPVPEFQVEENIVLQSVKKLYSRPDLAQVSVSHSGLAAKKTLNDSSFPFCEDIGSHKSPHESTIGKSINAFASTIVNSKQASRKKAKNSA